MCQDQMSFLIHCIYCYLIDLLIVNDVDNQLDLCCLNLLNSIYHQMNYLNRQNLLNLTFLNDSMLLKYYQEIVQ